MNDHLRAYRGYGPVAYAANLLFLACLPIAVVLALTGRWPLGLIVLLVGTPVFWGIRNRAVARATVEGERSEPPPFAPQAHGEDGRTADISWAEIASTILPPDHPLVQSLGWPGETFHPELGVVEWDQYLATLPEPDRLRSVQAAGRTLVLTNWRVLVLEERGYGALVTLPLEDIEDVSLALPPGKVLELGETAIQVRFHSNGVRRRVRWATRTPDAEVFAAKLRDYAAQKATLLARWAREGRPLYSRLQSGDAPERADEPVGTDIPPERKLNAARMIANELMSLISEGGSVSSVLADFPSDPRVRDIGLNLSGAIRDLASAHIERLRNQPGWRKRAEDGLGTAAYVERLIVPHHELSPFNSLGSIDASVESVADALLNASGAEQEQKRGRAWRWASIAERQLEDTGEPYLTALAGSACRLAEGSFATQPPDEPPDE